MPLPGDYADKDLTCGSWDLNCFPPSQSPSSQMSPSGIIGSQREHYVLRCEPDVIVNAVEQSVRRVTTKTPDAIPMGSLDVTDGVGSPAVYTYTPVRLLSEGGWWVGLDPDGKPTKLPGAVYTMGTIDFTPVFQRVYRTYLTKRKFNGTIDWDVDITDYLSWPGIAGEHQLWSQQPAANLPCLYQIWQMQEVGPFLFLLAQHVTQGISAKHNRTVSPLS